MDKSSKLKELKTAHRQACLVKHFIENEFNVLKADLEKDTLIKVPGSLEDTIRKNKEINLGALGQTVLYLNTQIDNLDYIMNNFNKVEKALKDKQ